MSTQLKNDVLNLFPDNATGEISPADLREFVNTIFDSKENVIYKKNTSAEIPLDNTYVETNDLMVILNGNDRGIYRVINNQPTDLNDLELIIAPNDTTLPDCPPNDNKYYSLSCYNSSISWEQRLTPYIAGRMDIQDILNLTPENPGVLYIANNTDQSARVPGEYNDVYSWDGCYWINLGKIFAPERRFRFTASDGQQDFDCNKDLNLDALVFISGSLQPTNTYTISGSVMHYNTPLSDGTDVLIIS